MRIGFLMLYLHFTLCFLVYSKGQIPRHVFKSKFCMRSFCSAQYFRSSTFHDKKCVLYFHLVLILKNAEIATSAVFCKNA